MHFIFVLTITNSSRKKSNLLGYRAEIVCVQKISDSNWMRLHRSNVCSLSLGVVLHQNVQITQNGVKVIFSNSTPYNRSSSLEKEIITRKSQIM